MENVLKNIQNNPELFFKLMYELLFIPVRNTGATLAFGTILMNNKHVTLRNSGNNIVVSRYATVDGNMKWSFG